MRTEDLRLVHLRIPKRLIDRLDHEAIDRNLYRAEMLAAILEERYGKRPAPEPEIDPGIYRDDSNPKEIPI